MKLSAFIHNRYRMAACSALLNTICHVSFEAISPHLLSLFFLFLHVFSSVHRLLQTLVGLLLFQFLTGPVDHIFGLLMHLRSRAFEYEADGIGSLFLMFKSFKASACS